MPENSSSSNTTIFPIHSNDEQDERIRSKKPLPGILDEETKDIAPSFHHLSHNLPSLRRDSLLFISEMMSSPSLLSPESSPLVPRSPESRWSVSSNPCTPFPPLLYRCISSLRHEGNIYCIAMAKGVLFTGSISNYIRAWQPFDCREKGYIQTSSGKVRAMIVHNGMLFTSHKDNKIRVWDIASYNSHSRPKKITTLPKLNPLRFFLSKTSSNSQHKDTITCMAFNHNEGIIYTGSWDKTVKAWKLSDRKCIDSFAAHADNINAMVINQDGFLFTCSSDGTLKMWNKVHGETFHTLTMTLTFHPFPIYALALSAPSPSQRSILYSGSSDGCINVWEQQISGRYDHEGCIQGHQFAILCLATIENLVISGSEDSMIKIWRRGTEEMKVYECMAVLEGHRGPVKCLAACLEKDNIVMGFLVFSASSDRSFKVWRVKVFPPDQIKVNNHQSESCVDDGDEFTPALSPSWVERKRRSTSINT